MKISEIARMAGVSSAAVSRYINGGSISEEKKQRIKKVIEETGASSMKEMGKVMGIANKKLSGQADGKIISAIVKRLLS